MKVHLLLTPNLNSTKPDTCEVINDFGQLTVVFGDMTDTERGLHCFVEDTKENIQNWLSPFDYVVLGDGNPFFESFKREKIKSN